MTNERLENNQLLSNHTVRKVIEDWHGKQSLSVNPQEVLGQGRFGRVMAGTLNIDGGRVIKVEEII